MSSVRPTVERLQLGVSLTRLRTAARKSQSEAASAIDRTAARLSQVENGKGSLGTEELLKLLDFYGVQGNERNTILALGTAARRRSVRRGYVDTLPEPFQRLVEMQVAASRISWYECGVIPGLVQSPDYVQAIMALSNSIYWEPSEEETGNRISFRLDHQRRVLECGGPKDITVIFTEDSLQHTVGSTSVMRGQVLHLLQLLERHENLTIRVVLNSAVDNPALGGGLVLLDFQESSPVSFAPLLYGPCTYYDQAEDLATMQRMYLRVEELALSRERTRELLIDLVRKDA
ncbi:helix-turn-helix domain-containing protein [Actinosynnema pretiosum subsp. pretiosum]|uniref:Transcriptional regulator, XRE family n=2 Tax=Actinosynnema TaxID=40566 RepID=C6WSC4_ACTMD|nr:helix-turn-helix transcriptional regulator [Actinosynnema mirum]ACU40794.1 transcriptional regulator, XRE family [Actinosynnema mirum DSM 43827]AXX34302.1 Putative DNA-binding protein [Actinosynnema pretiosum subsp. pretiosum]QUF01991.1 helix-turn-helix domain-containing protein [Actinosynnema pretiosum subsp. pretiosum]